MSVVVNPGIAGGGSSGGGGGSGAVSSVNGQTGDVTIDKAGIGLPAVDNLSFLAMMAAAATMTNKGIDGSTNTLTNIPQSAVSGLVSALGAAGSVVPLGQVYNQTKTDANTTESTLWTLSIPANTIGAKDMLVVESYWENPNSATVKTFRAKIGGNTFHTDQNTTQTAIMLRSTLTAMNATNSQRGQISWTAGGFNGTNNGAALTQDMTTTQSLTLTAQWGTAGSGSNSITLVHARAYVIRGV